MTTPIRAVRRALGLSQREFGLRLGLADSSADRTVRRWEERGPTGPAALATTYLAQRPPLDESPRGASPEYVAAHTPGRTLDERLKIAERSDARLSDREETPCPAISQACFLLTKRQGFSTLLYPH